MRLRIVNGYVELRRPHGWDCVSVHYLERLSPNTQAIVKLYLAKKDGPFEWPDMWWDEDELKWQPFNPTGRTKDETSLESFIRNCRSKHVS